MLEARGGRRLAAQSCIEAFLDPAERAQLTERAFIMSPGWLRECWRSIFVNGLGWDEIDGRINFGLYDVVVVLDFGLEPIDDIAVLEFFDFTQTPVEIVPATLDWFRQRVAELLQEPMMMRCTCEEVSRGRPASRRSAWPTCGSSRT